MQKILYAFLIILLMNFWALALESSQVRKRSEVPEKYKWDLSDLYTSDEAWEEAKNKVAKKIETISQFKGQLAESASGLLSCLEFSTEILKELRRLSSYSWNKTRQDLRDSHYRAMDGEMSQLYSVYNANAAFIEPEILDMEEETIQNFLYTESGLIPHVFYLNDLMRRKKHTLSDGEEKIIAEAGRMAFAPSALYNTFINTDFVNAEVTLSTGENVKLDRAGFRRYRGIADREDRELVCRTFYSALNKWRSPFGDLLNAKVNTDVFNTRARDYSDCLEMTLEPDNIPAAVFHNLIAQSNKHLDKFHRYLKIQKRLLGVDKLTYTDLLVPTFNDVDLNYAIEDAKKLIQESLEPLGERYTSVIRKAFKSRWIDFFPTPGKRSNAYTDKGAYAEHPYILMNYTGKYNDMAILIHELGHALHRYFADRGQPYRAAFYPSFLAEVASTFNELLLKKKVLEKIKDDDMRLYLLLSRFESSIFNRTMTSEFELKIHQEVENGKALTGDSISRIYLEILRKYYGHDQGICIVPDFIDTEWIFNRLLFIDTYRSYVYATSQTAATILAEKVLSGEKGAVRRYLDFLSAGGSGSPINTLKRAGVDMTSADPFEKTMDAMVRATDEIEEILKKKGM